MGWAEIIIGFFLLIGGGAAAGLVLGLYLVKRRP